jgi:hypothetical protein
MVTERAVSFGPLGRLSGVLAEPTSASRARPGAPAVLLWNVGVNHHVGPYRFHVDLARQLSRSGFFSLRFDLSGQGDSEVRRDPLREMERALDDLREAAALVGKRSGQERIVPLGFCSSVDAAHRFALIDPRVVGVCFIEGYAHRTAGFYARYPLRLLERTRWRRAIARRIPASLRGAPVVRRLGRIPFSISEDDLIYVREYPSPAELSHDYRALAARGTQMLFVYVGKDSGYNHRRQLFEFVGAAGIERHIEIDYYADADHTFFLASDRMRVIRRTCTWMEARFTAPKSEAPMSLLAPEDR